MAYRKRPRPSPQASSCPGSATSLEHVPEALLLLRVFHTLFPPPFHPLLYLQTPTLPSSL